MQLSGPGVCVRAGGYQSLAARLYIKVQVGELQKRSGFHCHSQSFITAQRCSVERWGGNRLNKYWQSFPLKEGDTQWLLPLCCSQTCSRWWGWLPVTHLGQTHKPAESVLKKLQIFSFCFDVLLVKEFRGASCAFPNSLWIGASKIKKFYKIFLKHLSCSTWEFLWFHACNSAVWKYRSML